MPTGEIHVSQDQIRLVVEPNPGGRKVGIANDDWGRLPEPLMRKVRRQFVSFGESAIELDDAEHAAIVALAREIEEERRGMDSHRRFGRRLGER